MPGHTVNTTSAAIPAATENKHLLDGIAMAVLLVAAAVLMVESFATSLLFDELLTYFSATLATPSLIWHALVNAPLNSDPPLYHFIEHYTQSILGNSDLALRLPSIAGMLIALGLIYLYARRVGRAAAGILAMTFVVASGAFFYGYNARPYALALMAAAGALVSWQNIVHQRARAASLISFGACLALADSVQYYSVLLCVPFAISEAVRTLRTRRIDWPVWFAMAAGNLSMLVILPFMPSMRAWQRSPWRGVVRGDLLASYRLYFHSVRILITILAVLACGYAARFALARARRAHPIALRPIELRTEEFAALIAFSLYPLVVFAMSVGFTHTFAERFTLPAILGLSILLGLALTTILNSEQALLAVAGLVMSVAPLHAVASVRSSRGPQTRYSLHYGPALAQDTAVFSQLPTTSRIVMADDVPYLRSMRYASDPVRNRLTFLDVNESPTRDMRKEFHELIALGVRVGIGMPTATASQVQSLKDPFFLICCRSFEKTDDRVMALRNSLGSRAVEIGTFRYWPVYLVRP